MESLLASGNGMGAGVDVSTAENWPQPNNTVNNKIAKNTSINLFIFAKSIIQASTALNYEPSNNSQFDKCLHLIRNSNTAYSM